jgi:hypothetical protein
MDEAHRQLREELFCEETGLIYDSISGDSHERRFEHLPSLEEIRLVVPNPHGYATGMEDSMLNAGFAMEMCLRRAEVAPERRDEFAEFAGRLLNGMMRCVQVHGVSGYVVRSVSPRDGSSCYPESSRDQFTLFVYGLWRYYRSAFAADEQKAVIRRVLADIADFAESKMTAATDYNLGRLDGYPGVNLRMLQVQCHEAMRLPMIFAAAYDATRKHRFLDWYRRYVPQALNESERLGERRRPWWHIELSQMQFSLALCRAVDTDPERAERLDTLMNEVAALAEAQTSQVHLPRMLDFDGPWNPPAHAWRDAQRFSLQRFDLGECALHGGHLYLKGEESTEFKEAFDRLRAPGNMITAMLLAPGYQPAPDFGERFSRALAAPVYAGHTSAGLVNLLCAYYLAKARGGLL